MSQEITPEHIEKNILKAKSGDQKAFNFLLDTFWADVYGFQLTRTSNENDAEDITIQTFSKAFDKIDSFDGAYDFKPWLFAISKNIHIDLIRKRKKNIINTSTSHQEAAYQIADDSPTIEDQIIIEQNLAKLLKCIKQLKPHYQEVINLRYFQEMSYQEIATFLDEPLNNIKVKLLRAKKLLAEIIKNKKY